MQNNKEEQNSQNIITNDFLNKIKENNKLFDEKMTQLNKKKIEVIKSKKKKSKKPKDPLILSINKEIQLNFDNTKKQIKKYTINKEHQITILNVGKKENPTPINSNLKQINDSKEYTLVIDNNISFDYISKNLKNYSEEEQDIYFISKIRQLQKDLKYKADLIIDLQNKLKQKDENFVKMTKIEIEELNNKIKIISQENEQKLKEIQKLETDNYNQKIVIERMGGQIQDSKKEVLVKVEEINNLNNIIEKYKNDATLFENKMNCLESINKTSSQELDLLKTNLNKIKKEKEKMEKVIDEQKVKMENYKKHINTLRKFICEDDENIKINSKINNLISNNLDNNMFIEEKNFKLEEEKKENENNNIENDDDYFMNGINKEKNISKINKNDNQEVITSYQFTKKNHRKTNSEIMNDIDNEILQANKNSQNPNSHNKNRNKSKNKEITISSLTKRVKRNLDYENEENKEFYYTYNDFNDLKQISKKENDVTYFPSEKYLVERKDEINKLESQLDLLYKEKNSLENELVKFPEHPKTLKEIKIKKALNVQLSINENNINNIRIKIRKIKEA